jgi:hypothetical protein
MIESHHRGRKVDTSAIKRPVRPSVMLRTAIRCSSYCSSSRAPSWSANAVCNLAIVLGPVHRDISSVQQVSDFSAIGPPKTITTNTTMELVSRARMEKGKRVMIFAVQRMQCAATSPVSCAIRWCDGGPYEALQSRWPDAAMQAARGMARATTRRSHGSEHEILQSSTDVSVAARPGQQVTQAGQLAVSVALPITARPVLHNTTVYDGVQQVIAARYSVRGRNLDD